MMWNLYREKTSDYYIDIDFTLLIDSMDEAVAEETIKKVFKYMSGYVVLSIEPAEEESLKAVVGIEEEYTGFDHEDAIDRLVEDVKEQIYKNKVIWDWDWELNRVKAA